MQRRGHFDDCDLNVRHGKMKVKQKEHEQEQGLEWDKAFGSCSSKFGVKVEINNKKEGKVRK